MSADRPSVDDLDQLTTEQLRHRAFDLAEQRHDIGFFWDLVKHLEPSHELAREDGSSGHVTGGIAEAIEVVRELLGGKLSGNEEFVRARFINYLHTH